MNYDNCSNIGRLMMAYGKYFKAYMKKELTGEGLNVADAMIMLSLYEKDGRTQDSLMEQVHYDKSVVARTMQSLEENDYIVRNPNPEDGRSWVFRVTEKGLAKKPVIISALRGWSSLAFRDIDHEKIDELHETLMTIVGNVRP